MRTSLVALAALALLAAVFLPGRAVVNADETAVTLEDAPDVAENIAAHTSSATDAEVTEREERAIKLDGMSVDESKQLADKAEKFEFQAEVNRMMKLIINSLYKNKDIFLRELISNASDALDKIRFLALTDKSVLGTTPDLQIKIHVDKENKVLHITDTGIGMTKAELVRNLGTIAKSGTSEFLAKASEGGADTGNLIGQFGVGFYSAFLVADTVVVTSKHNDDAQHIWTSDASSFSVAVDPREDEQLGRGTRVSLYMKEEAEEFLEENRIRDLIKKYSEFINFDIFLYTSKTVEVDPAELEKEAEEAEAEAAEEAESTEEGEEDEETDEEADEEASSEKPVSTTKTVWDWEVINANKPIWTRNAKDIEEEEYSKFYKAFSRDETDPIGYIHFTAEGEVTFRSILYIPGTAPAGFYQEYGRRGQNIKLYVRRVFITDEFEDLLPKYLGFLRGVVDSDDLPLNVSRETLQQHKLLKVIKKKLVRKALEMIKKLKEEDFEKFWKEYGTSIKLGLIEDYGNRTRLAKLLRFESSHDAAKTTGLEAYLGRMKKGQETIFFMAAASRKEAETSPFVERLLKRGFEVLYLTQPVDEYAVQNLPEFEGKKFQNVAKEGLNLGEDSEAAKEAKEKAETEFKPLTAYLGKVLASDIDKAVISDRLSESPCALVASQYGWSGNMERIMKAQAYAKGDDSSSFYSTQKKTLEINPRHPLIKNLLQRARAEEDKGEDDAKDSTLEDTVRVLLDTARLRSGYMLSDSVTFAQRIERMLRSSAGVDLNAAVDPEPEVEAPAEEEEAAAEDGEEVEATEQASAESGDLEGDEQDVEHEEL